MKIRHLLATAVLFVTSAVAVMAQGAQVPAIPVDPAVRTGKLANGLTYYIRHNDYPENRVNFYIAQRVGSIQEEEDQRGLAHFLEHMAFNGSDNFKGNGLIDYLRSLGVEFGSDLNAYTAVDETVYNIDNVPSGNVAALDSCLLILKDWSNGLTLDPKEIDKERGVINNEWRLRSSGIQRMLERNLEALYPGSKYGRRMPIGLMSVVNNFKPETLRKYYQKWYRPDNQAIIVVGDIDVDRTEAKVKEMFSTIKLAPNAVPVVPEQVPDNNEAIIIVDKDKEQQMDLVHIMFKHDAVPDSLKGTMPYLVHRYAVSLATQMLNQRLAELTQNPDCPFVQAMVEDGDYIYAKTKDAFLAICVPKPGMVNEAIAATTREVLRATKFGFTPTEFARAKSEYMSALEKMYVNRDKQMNSLYCQEYTQNFLSSEPIPSIEQEYMIMQQLAPAIHVDVVNQVMPQLVSLTDTNLVVFSMNVEKEGAVYPTAESIKKAIDGVHAEQLTAWVDNVKNEPLISKLPAKGRIKSEKVNKTLGYKELTLSNGAALAGKQVGVTLSLSELHETVSGRSTPKDLETMFQMTYLYFTDIKKDEKSYESLMATLGTMLKNQEMMPDQIFRDSLRMTLYKRNPRFTVFKAADLKDINYDRILQIAKERTANAADFTFTFVGNFDEDSIRPLIEQYIASLPAVGVKEQWRKMSTYATGNVENIFTRKMETPKANAYMYWYNLKEPYSVETAVTADAAGQVLNIVYYQKIREEASAAYATQAVGMASVGSDTPYTGIAGICPMDPTKSDLALKIMEEEAARMCKTVDADMLKKTKELMLKQADDNAKTNSYWVNAIGTYDEYGVDIVTPYKDAVNALTPAKVAKFMKKVIFGGGNHVKVVMLPEAETK